MKGGKREKEREEDGEKERDRTLETSRPEFRKQDRTFQDLQKLIRAVGAKLCTFMEEYQTMYQMQMYHP